MLDAAGRLGPNQEKRELVTNADEGRLTEVYL